MTTVAASNLVAEALKPLPGGSRQFVEGQGPVEVSSEVEVSRREAAGEVSPPSKALPSHEPPRAPGLHPGSTAFSLYRRPTLGKNTFSCSRTPG